MRKIKRGDIFYVTVDRSRPEVGSEQRKGRPAVVVSNDANNRFSTVVEVVYLTTSQQKANLPTHVLVGCGDQKSTALCEQVDSVSIRLLGRYFGRCNESEMRQITRALGVSLGIWGAASHRDKEGQHGTSHMDALARP